MDMFDKPLASVQDILFNAAQFAPRLLVAVVLLLLGFVVASLLRKGTAKLLRLMRVNEAADRIGLESFLLRGGVRFTTVTIIAQTVYWTCFFLVVILVLNILGLDKASLLLGRIVLYLPNVFIAAVVLIFGSLLAKFIGGLVDAYLNNLGIASAQLISTIARVAIWLFVAFITFEQLSIGTPILESAFQMAFAGLALGFGLAFGLGGQETAKKIAEKWYKRLSTKE